MKITLLALMLSLSAGARAASHAPSETLDQLQECAAGHCWDTKGNQVTTPPEGAVYLKHLEHVRSWGDKSPKEPPRYTVYTREEVHAIRQQQAYVGAAIGAATGAMIGFFFGGIPGAVVGGLIAAAAAYFILRPKK